MKPITILIIFSILCQASSRSCVCWPCFLPLFTAQTLVGFPLPSLQLGNSASHRSSLTDLPAGLCTHSKTLLITWFSLTFLMFSSLPSLLYESWFSCFLHSLLFLLFLLPCTPQVSSWGSFLSSLLFLSQKASLLLDFGHFSNVDNARINISQCNLLI